MPLRRTDEVDVWIEREGPTDKAQRVVWRFLRHVGDTSWAAPSVPILELSRQPYNEVRTAVLDVPGESNVQIWYRHYYTSDDVDVIDVTQLMP